MTSAKRVVEIVLAFTAFASALLLVWVASVFGLGLPIYLAATVGAWLLFAFVLPTLTGVFGPEKSLLASGRGGNIRRTTKASSFPISRTSVWASDRSRPIAGRADRPATTCNNHRQHRPSPAPVFENVT